MKLTYLSELQERVEERLTVESPNEWTIERISHYSRFPYAGELIVVDSDSRYLSKICDELLLGKLEPIGIHPRNPFYCICSRSDSGIFWWFVAIAKYKLLLTQCKLTEVRIRHLYSWGMVFCPLGEEFSWKKHLPLDWLLIINAICVFGLTVCSAAWLSIGGYWQAVCCLLLSLKRMIELGFWRNQLINKRDLEQRMVSLGCVFQAANITPTDEEFEDCLSERTNPQQVAAGCLANRIKQAIAKVNLCQYYNGEEALSCAVHPENYKLGMCNENCPSFMSIDNQQKD